MNVRVSRTSSLVVLLGAVAVLAWSASPALAASPTVTLVGPRGSAPPPTRPRVPSATPPASKTPAKPPVAPVPKLRNATVQGDLPLTGFTQMVVDDADKLVFLTGSASDSKVVAANFDASINTTLTGFTDATDMVLDSATHTLYVSETSADTIATIDTRTLTAGPTYFLGSGVCPGPLALAGGVLWFGYTCLQYANVETTGLGALDTSVTPATVTTYPGGVGGELTRAVGTMLSDPADPNLIFVSDWDNSGIYAPTLYEYDVSTTPPTLVVSYSTGNTYSHTTTLAQAAMMPDGSGMVTAAYEPTYLEVWASSNLHQTATYSMAGQNPFAVTVTSGGSYVIGGTATATSGPPDVYVFPTGQAQPIDELDVGTLPGGGEGSMSYGGLGVSADASTLFSVVRGPSGDLYLGVTGQPTLPGSTITVNSSHFYTAGQTATFTGTLTLLDGASAGGLPVSVACTNSAGTSTFSTTTLPDGTYSVADPDTSVVGTYQCSASYAGDASHHGSIAWTTIYTSQITSTLGLTGPAGPLKYKTTGTLTATLSDFSTSPNPPNPPIQNDTITFTIKPAGKSQYTRTATMTAGANSTYVADLSFTFERDTTITASWAGDVSYQAESSVPITVDVTVTIKGSLKNYYGSSGSYRLYHYTTNCPNSGKGCPTYLVTISNPSLSGSKVKVEIEIYQNGAWRFANSGTFKLNSKSQVSVIIVYSGKSIIGMKQRIDAESLNTNYVQSTTKWAYFKVTN